MIHNIFLSHRMDFLPAEKCQATATKYKNLLSDLPISLISMADELNKELTGITDRDIVAKCLASIDKSKLLIFDCSERNWTYVGCIFELVYAYHAQIPIAIYPGETNMSDRPWLRYHATIIATSLFEIHDFVTKQLNNWQDR